MLLVLYSRSTYRCRWQEERAVLRVIKELQQVRVELEQPFDVYSVVEAKPTPTKITWYKDGVQIDDVTRYL